ncbi:MAG: LysR family transcriptional regulator [Rhodospirillales bacterium]
MQYTLKQLRYVVAAAEEANVTAAAARLNVSQPSVSAAIRQVEEAFGVQLFIRHHARGLALTPAGRRVVAEARALLSQANELEAHARGYASTIAGRLDIGCFTTIAPFLMPQLISAFAGRHPNVRVRAHEGDLQTITQNLLAGRFELAVIYELGLDPALETETLASVTPSAVLPAGHPLAAREEVSLVELAREKLVLLDLPHSREYFLSMFSSRNLAPVIRHRTESFEMARGLVGAGEGVALLNLVPASNVTYGGTEVAVRPLAERPPGLRIVLARPGQLRLSAAAEAFRTICRETLAAD